MDADRFWGDGREDGQLGDKTMNHFVVREPSGGEGPVDFSLNDVGDKAYAEVEADLLRIVQRHNAAFDAAGNVKPGMQQVYARGPLLYTVEETYVGGGSRSSRLGGMYV
ncbi:MAG: hypothetical protein M3380_07715, partial [Chloroflexota bacterium]|nr:hypothetical protein [Chloroflexota bacterium]